MTWKAARTARERKDDGDHRDRSPGPAGRAAACFARLWRAVGTVSNGWNRFWRLVGIYMPKRLYARSLLIVITPMILLQSVVTLVFMERHWQTVTQRLSTGNDARPRRDHRHDRDLSERRRLRQRHPDRPGTPVDEDRHPAARSRCRRRAASRSSRSSTRSFRPRSPARSTGRSGSTRSAIPSVLEVRIQLEDKVLRAFIRRSQAYASNTHIFLVWMVGTSLVLLMIAIPFLRNQIRPILKLAEAAESFGKGRPMPPDFRPRGAEEVRRAGFAFIQMRERIERQIEQRTAMLTGVSHDLRTILTRFKLQLALSGSKPDIEALDQRHRRHAVDARRLSRLRARRGRRGPGPLRPRRLFREACQGSEAAQAHADDDAHRRSDDPCPAERLCAAARQCDRQFAALRKERPRRGHPHAGLAHRHRRRRRAGHSRRRAARTSSSRSCGSTRPATSTPAAPDLASPSPATSPAAMAATSRWTTARWAACAPSCAFRPEPGISSDCASADGGTNIGVAHGQIFADNV